DGEAAASGKRSQIAFVRGQVAEILVRRARGAAIDAPRRDTERRRVQTLVVAVARAAPVMPEGPCHGPCVCSDTAQVVPSGTWTEGERIAWRADVPHVHPAAGRQAVAEPVCEPVSVRR